MEEKWMPVPMENHRAYFEVSNTGRVRRVKYDKRPGWPVPAEMKLFTDRDGYKCVALWDVLPSKKKRAYAVHKMVAKSFIQNPNNYPQINHIDEDKTNNSANNLEWCTAKHNIRHHDAHRRRIMPVAIVSKDGEIIRSFPSIIDAAASTGIFRQSISQCCNGRLGHAGEHVWRRVITDNNGNISLMIPNDETATRTRGREPVDQFSIDGNFIATHTNGSVAVVAVGGKKSSSSKIYSCCEKKYGFHSYMGYKWEFPNERSIQTMDKATSD